MSSGKGGKRRRSLPSLFNPLSLFGMGNTNNNSSIHRNGNTSHSHNDDEKISSSIDMNGTIKHNNYSINNNNTQIQYLSGHKDVVRCLCKIDSNRFASCSDDHLILIWDTNNGLLLDVLCGHKSSVISLIIIEYKSYKLLISSSLDNTIRIWNVSSTLSQGKCISILTKHKSPIIKILYFNKTKKIKYDGLISASNDGLIGVWSFNEDFDFDDDNDNDNDLNIFKLERIININDNSKEFTEILFLNTDLVKQLIIGCNCGKIIFINFDKNDRIKLINKHCRCIKYIYQSSIDRFITASYDGLICVWRIEPHFPQLLERINDVEQNISSWSKSPKSNSTIMTKNKKSKKNNNSENNTKQKREIITEAKDLRLNCFIDFYDECHDKYFIVSFSNSFVIFDSKFLVKSIIKNVYNDNTEIIKMTIFGDNDNLILITANNKHIIKLWNICKINLKSIETGVWLSCFRQELLYNLDSNDQYHKKNKNKNKKNIVNDLCIDYNKLLINKFNFHSDKIIQIKNLNNYTFVTCDKMHQIILWKDAYYVSYLQNKTIKQYYNLPTYN